MYCSRNPANFLNVERNIQVSRFLKTVQENFHLMSFPYYLHHLYPTENGMLLAYMGRYHEIYFGASRFRPTGERYPTVLIHWNIPHNVACVSLCTTTANLALAK